MATIAPDKAVISAWIDRDVRDELERRAIAADRSLSWLVRQVLAAHVEHEPMSDEREKTP
jgi:ribbon-helix-helix CopG family protein